MQRQRLASNQSSWNTKHNTKRSLKTSKYPTHQSQPTHSTLEWHEQLVILEMLANPDEIELHEVRKLNRDKTKFNMILKEQQQKPVANVRALLNTSDGSGTWLPRQRPRAGMGGAGQRKRRVERVAAIRLSLVDWDLRRQGAGVGQWGVIPRRI